MALPAHQLRRDPLARALRRLVLERAASKIAGVVRARAWLAVVATINTLRGEVPLVGAAVLATL